MSANPAFVFVEADPGDVVTLIDRARIAGMSLRGTVFSGPLGVVEVDDGAEDFDVSGFTSTVVSVYGPELTKSANLAAGRRVYDLVLEPSAWPVALVDGDSVVVVARRPARKRALAG